MHEPIGLGTAVAILRSVYGISRRELAEAAGISYAYLSNIETGEGNPSHRITERLANALGCRESALIGLAECDEFLVAERLLRDSPSWE